MTKANDLASLLDANGDVVSSALDNVPASDLVNDTTPQLGGNLDLNSNNITGTGNIDVTGTVTADGLTVDGKTVVGSSSSNALEIHSNGDTEIAFSYATKGNIYGKIIGDITQASPLGGDIAFQTATGGSLTERMRLTDGNLLIGKTALDYEGTAGFILRGDGFINAARSNGNVTDFNRLNSDGEIVRISKDGTTVGSIGVGNTNRPYIGSGDTGIMFDANNNAIYPWNTSTNNVPASDQVDLGYDATGLKFNNLYLGGGVYLGGTGSANYLDDYEEGVWYPVLKASSTQPTYGATNDVGSYVKIGNMVYVTWYSSVLNITNSGSGGAQIGGLPFTAASGTQEYWLFNYQHGTGIAGTNTSGGYIERNNTNLIFTQQGTVTNSTWAQLNGRYVMVSAAYRTA